MKRYRANKNTETNPNGNNEVHSEDCYHYSRLSSYADLGYHYGCQTAVEKAKSLGYYKADGCATCCPTCHKG